jgi:formylglycine-generating enzyme required for sulfatase activity
MRYFLLALMLCLCWSADAAWARSALHALVVGVNRYADVTLKDDVDGEFNPDLTNPDKDAQAIKQELEKDRGYSVTLLTDAAGETRKSNIEAKWAELLDGVQDGDVVLFYFAGHGVELKRNNYLLPLDATYRWNWSAQDRVEKLASSSIEFQSLVDLLAKKQDSHKRLIGIFIVDACRENPFDFSGAKGKLVVELGPRISPSRQVFMMFSAGAGQTALDGARGHSVYAEALLPLLKKKDITLSQMAQQLRVDVYKAAQQYQDDDSKPHLQTPAYYDQLETSRTLSGDPGQPEKIVAANDLIGIRSRSLGHRDTILECPFCPELVVLRSGDYEMGSGKAEEGHAANEEPRHAVKIDKKFAIGKYEVTNREWDRCVEEGGCAKRPPHGERDALKPAVDISWSDASDYLRWLSGKTHATYRLPTEAEWEYAARADARKENGAAPRYFFGDEVALLCQYANGADLSVGVLPYANRLCDDSVARETSIVGRYKPNDWGLYDTFGNAWEWVQDCWHETYEKAPADGSAWINAECSRHVARGGSWRSGADALRSAARNAFPSDRRRSTIGFRVVREIDD